MHLIFLKKHFTGTVCVLRKVVNGKGLGIDKQIMQAHIRQANARCYFPRTAPDATMSCCHQFYESARAHSKPTKFKIGLNPSWYPAIRKILHTPAVTINFMEVWAHSKPTWFEIGLNPTGTPQPTGK